MQIETVGGDRSNQRGGKLFNEKKKAKRESKRGQKRRGRFFISGAY